MLTWTSVVAAAPTDADIAHAVARREALVIRPLLEFAPLRQAMGLGVVDSVTDAPAAATVGTTNARRRSTGTKASKAGATSRAATGDTAATAKQSAKPKQPAKPRRTAAARTPETAAA